MESVRCDFSVILPATREGNLSLCVTALLAFAPHTVARAFSIERFAMVTKNVSRAVFFISTVTKFAV